MSSINISSLSMYIRQNGSNLQYSDTLNGTYVNMGIGPYTLTFDLSATIYLATDLSLNSVNSRFIISTNNIVFDGNNKIVNINYVNYYPGLLRVSDESYKLTIKNTGIRAIGGSLDSRTGYLVKTMGNGSSIDKCYVIANTISQFSGVMCYHIDNGSVTNCYAYTNYLSNDCAGLCYEGSNITFNACYVYTTFNDYACAGIVRNGTNMTVVNCYAIVNDLYASNCSAISNYASPITINNCYVVNALNPGNDNVFSPNTTAVNSLTDTTWIDSRALSVLSSNWISIGTNMPFLNKNYSFQNYSSLDVSLTQVSARNFSSSATIIRNNFAVSSPAINIDTSGTITINTFNPDTLNFNVATYESFDVSMPYTVIYGYIINVFNIQIIEALKIYLKTVSNTLCSSNDVSGSFTPVTFPYDISNTQDTYVEVLSDFDISSSTMYITTSSDNVMFNGNYKNINVKNVSGFGGLLRPLKTLYVLNTCVYSCGTSSLASGNGWIASTLNNNSKISYSFALGNSSYNSGGICGKASYSVIENCYFYGVIPNGSSGICGSLSTYTNINSCYIISSQISGNGGGICGGNSDNIVIDNCYASSYLATGGSGICATNCSYVTIKNSYFAGGISGSAYAYTGSTNNITILNCTNTPVFNGWSDTSANAVLKSNWYSINSNTPFINKNFNRSLYSDNYISETYTGSNVTTLTNLDRTFSRYVMDISSRDISLNSDGDILFNSLNLGTYTLNLYASYVNSFIPSPIAYPYNYTVTNVSYSLTMYDPYQTISSEEATIIYPTSLFLKQDLSNNIVYSFNRDNSYLNVSFPFAINVANTLTITLLSDINITDPTQFILCYGNGFTFDGNGYMLKINGVDSYIGFIVSDKTMTIRDLGIDISQSSIVPGSGILARYLFNSVVRRCFINSKTFIGPMIGLNSDTVSLIDCYVLNQEILNGSGGVGAFCSNNSKNITINNSYVILDSNIDISCGGFVGRKSSNVAINNSYCMTANNTFGGFLGELCTGTISNSYLIRTTGNSSFFGSESTVTVSNTVCNSSWSDTVANTLLSSSWISLSTNTPYKNKNFTQNIYEDDSYYDEYNYYQKLIRVPLRNYFTNYSIISGDISGITIDNSGTLIYDSLSEGTYTSQILAYTNNANILNNYKIYNYRFTSYYYEVNNFYLLDISYPNELDISGNIYIREDEGTFYYSRNNLLYAELFLPVKFKHNNQPATVFLESDLTFTQDSDYFVAFENNFEFNGNGHKIYLNEIPSYHSVFINDDNIVTIRNLGIINNSTGFNSPGALSRRLRNSFIYSCYSIGMSLLGNYTFNTLIQFSYCLLNRAEHMGIFMGNNCKNCTIEYSYCLVNDIDVGSAFYGIDTSYCTVSKCYSVINTLVNHSGICFGPNTSYPVVTNSFFVVKNNSTGNTYCGTNTLINGSFTNNQILSAWSDISFNSNNTLSSAFIKFRENMPPLFRRDDTKVNNQYYRSIYDVSTIEVFYNNVTIDISKTPIFYNNNYELMYDLSNNNVIVDLNTGDLDISVNRIGNQIINIVTYDTSFNIVNNYSMPYGYFIDTIYLHSLVPPISRICFLENTKVLTDNGSYVNVSEIDKNPYKYLINNKIPIITKTKSLDKYLVKVEKNSISENVPNEDLILTQNHKILYNNSFVCVSDLIKSNMKIYYIKYNSELLYNIILNNESLNVNGLIVESLNINNKIAKMFLEKEGNENIWNDKINNYNKSIVKSNNLYIIGYNHNQMSEYK